MHTKTWKKAALFSLTMSWSVFTTGCIPPAILKALLGLVESIFTDTTGGKTPGATTGTDSTLNTSNKGKNGLDKDSKGNVKVAGSTDAAKNTPEQPRKPSAGDGLATDAVESGSTDSADSSKAKEASRVTDAMKGQIASLTDRAEAVSVIANAGLEFVERDMPDCNRAGLAQEKLDRGREFGALVGKARDVRGALATVLGSVAPAAEQTAAIEAARGKLEAYEVLLAGDGGAGQIRGAPVACRSAFRAAFDTMKSDPNSDSALGSASADSLIGQCRQTMKRIKAECGS